MDARDRGETADLAIGAVTVVASLSILAGLIGIVVPVLAGLLLVWAAVMLWPARHTHRPVGWSSLFATT
jgi:uncharacterized protein YqgC (DUF456 family)